MCQISINVLLLEGNADAATRYEVKGWDLVGYRIPRVDLDKYKNREELKYSGIYFLLGKNTAGDRVIYVGQASTRANGKGVLGRVKEHTWSTNEDYWTEAIMFVPHTDTFDSADLCYLESKMCQAITEANICRCKNGNNPSVGNISEGDIGNLNNYLSWIQTFLKIMNIRVFDNKDAETFICDSNGSNAKGRRNLEGFLILKGSKIASRESLSCPDKIKKIRKQLRLDNWTLKDNYQANSPSEAAGIVCGASVNGLTTWSNLEGILLKDCN